MDCGYQEFYIESACHFLGQDESVGGVDVLCFPLFLLELLYHQQYSIL